MAAGKDQKETKKEVDALGDALKAVDKQLDKLRKLTKSDLAVQPMLKIMDMAYKQQHAQMQLMVKLFK